MAPRVGGPEKANQRVVHPTTDGRMPPCKRRHSLLEREEGAGDSELFFALDNLELVCRRHHEHREREARADFSSGEGVPLATVDKR
jgi:hypothetical protein